MSGSRKKEKLPVDDDRPAHHRIHSYVRKKDRTGEQIKRGSTKISPYETKLPLFATPRPKLEKRERISEKLDEVALHTGAFMPSRKMDFEFYCFFQKRGLHKRETTLQKEVRLGKR